MSYTCDFITFHYTLELAIEFISWKHKEIFPYNPTLFQKKALVPKAIFCFRHNVFFAQELYV